MEDKMTNPFVPGTFAPRTTPEEYPERQYEMPQAEQVQPKQDDGVQIDDDFSFEGYQVVRKEFFSHKFDPQLTIKDNSITFNNACILKLEKVVYIQFLINPETKQLVIRP